MGTFVAVLEILALVCLFAPFAAVAPRLLGVWVTERRGDFLVAICGFAAFGGFIGGYAGATSHAGSTPSAVIRAVLLAVIVGSVMAEIGSVILAVNVFFIDHVGGPYRTLIRRVSPRRSDRLADFQAHLPFYSLITPISMIRSQKSRRG